MEVLRYLRKQKKLSQLDLAKIFNVAQNTVSQWENGERKPDLDILVKLAQFFNVTTDYLLGKSFHPLECECGFRFTAEGDDNSPEHKADHNRYMLFKKRFGFFTLETAELQQNYHKAVDLSKDLTESERIKFIEHSFQRYFTSSAFKSNWDNHPNFSDYCAMLLNQEYYKNNIPKKIYQVLVSKYGVKPGLPEGKTIWKDISLEKDKEIANTLPTLTTRDERSIQKRIQAILDDLAPSNSAMAYFDGDEPMTDEDRELLRISLENTMRLAKQMAKQKFTPKKYRK